MRKTLQSSHMEKKGEGGGGLKAIMAPFRPALCGFSSPFLSPLHRRTRRRRFKTSSYKKAEIGEFFFFPFFQESSLEEEIGVSLLFLGETVYFMGWRRRRRRRERKGVSFS